VEELEKFIKQDKNFIELLGDRLEEEAHGLAVTTIYDFKPLDKPYQDISWYRMSDGYLVDLDSLWDVAKEVAEEE